MEESENYKKLMEEIPLKIQLKVCEEAMDIQQTYIEELEKQLSLYGVGSNKVELGCEHKWLMKFNSDNFIIGKQCSKCNEYIAY